MKPLLFSILFLFFNIINPFAQDRRIIFPEDKTISHEDSMGIILIDHIYNGRREKAVEMLKSGKVGGYVKDINGYYAIEYAFERKDTNLISLLIEKGAAIDDKYWWTTKSYYPPENFILSEKDIQIRRLILPISRGYITPDTLIADYYSKKYIEIINNSPSKNTLISVYILNGYYSMIKKFYERSVIFPDSFNYDSPIINSCISGNYELFKLFVDKGYNINQETIYGQNLLHFACIGGDEKIISYLISEGLDKEKKCSVLEENWRFYTPETPLLCLLKGKLKSPELIKLFIPKNLNPTVDYWRFLYSHFQKINTRKTEMKNVYRATEILLDNGVTPNFSGEYVTHFYGYRGNNSLMHLADFCFFDDDYALKLAKLFVHFGIKISYINQNKNEDSFTRLYYGHNIYGCQYIYFKTYHYLLSICPYYSLDNYLPRDGTKIPRRPVLEWNDY